MLTIRQTATYWLRTENGNGEGKIYENAQIRLQGDKEAGTGAIEMESYNSAPKVIFGLGLVK